MTPLHMIILIECNGSETPGVNIKTEIWNSPAAQEYRREMSEMGLIYGHNLPRITEKGKAWLDKALSTPMPVQKWVFEDNKPDFLGGEAA